MDGPSPDSPHVSVLGAEVVAGLAPGGAAWILDATVGAGGHARLLLDAAGPSARLLGLDRDPSALELARARLAGFGERVRLVHASFADVASLAREAGAGPFQAALLDVGVSSMQVDRPERGFSFQRSGPLDMRMDPTAPLQASDLLRDLDEARLARLIEDLGEERFARRIARGIVEARRRAPLRTTDELEEVVWRAVPAAARHGRIHPATRTFQALRIAVNDELGQLEQGLAAVWSLLAPGGRLGVIAFHSLEDRLVKGFLKERRQSGEAELPTKKPLRPGDAEVTANPRARSARLRLAVRLG